MKIVDISAGLRPLITVIARDDNADDERTYAYLLRANTASSIIDSLVEELISAKFQPLPLKTV